MPKFFLPLALCLFCLLLISLSQPSLAHNSAADPWAPTPTDLKKALPNTRSQPQRLRPLTQLPPLPEDQRGIIRKVSLVSKQPVLALTFDLCELATSTSGCDMTLLGFLKAQNIPATLFMSGKWMRTHKARVKLFLQHPLFEIGNHNWSHGNCALLPLKDLEDEILWTQAQYELIREELAGEITDPTKLAKIASVPRLFRLPYGRSRPEALKTIAALGLTTVQWNIVGELGAVTNREQARRYAQSLASMTVPGSIVLFHANLVPVGTALLVEEYTRLMQAKGYRFLTVSELLQLGTPQRVQDGYFSSPGDNLHLDRRFGRYGTGLR